MQTKHMLLALLDVARGRLYSCCAPAPLFSIAGQIIYRGEMASNAEAIKE